MKKEYNYKMVSELIAGTGKQWFTISELAIKLGANKQKLRNIFNKNTFSSQDVVLYTTIGKTNYYEWESTKTFLDSYYIIGE